MVNSQEKNGKQAAKKNGKKKQSDGEGSEKTTKQQWAKNKAAA